MDELCSVLKELTPMKDATISAHKGSDAAVKRHLSTLKSCAAEVRTAALRAPKELLEGLDPAVHSISYLFVLDVLVEYVVCGLPVDREWVLDRVMHFMIRFDRDQSQYAGPAMLTLLERIGGGQLFPPLVAVELLSTAILRMDPSASCFTSTHLLLAKLAYSSNAIEPALPVLNTDILFYPSLPNPRDPIPRDHSLPSSSSSSPHTGLTDAVKAFTILEYNYVRGLIYISRRDWRRAQGAFEQVIAHPMKDRNVSRVMVEAYKRYILVGLLNQGEAPRIPSYMSQHALATYSAAAKLYAGVADIFSSFEPDKLRSHIENHMQVWEGDGTLSLLAEIKSSYQKRQIMGLRKVYQTISVAQIHSTTVNAETGRTLDTVAEVLALIRHMIQTGDLDGTLEQDSSGTYLSFRRDCDALSESEFADRIAQSHKAVAALGSAYRQMNDSLSSSQEYVKHVVREQQNLLKEPLDAGIGFSSSIGDDDEDLMDDVFTHH